MSTKPQPYFEPDFQPHFSHKPLPDANRTIRLLQIHPGHEEPLETSLHVRSLDTKPKYDALSYMWGSKDPTRSIVVDGEVFLLRPNIYSFLLRLRLQDKSRMVWLDSVCINQNDIDERGYQVSLMRDIYSSCRECLAWLGECDDRGDEVIEVLKRGATDAQGMLDMNYLVRQLYHSQLTDSFKKLLGHPYWGRIWMLQELTLPNKVTVHCGGNSCPLDLVPTQVRARMFEVFQQDRLAYQQWLRVFNPSAGTSQVVRIPFGHLQYASQGDSEREDEIYPYVIGYSDPTQQAGCCLGFVRANDNSRWEAVVVEEFSHPLVQRVASSQPSFSVLDKVSLSTVSRLSFSPIDFDPEEVFRAIESIFWCTSNTSSEQLLDERRRHSSARKRDFSSSDFRNFLESADRWFCTDIRDRIFGVLGVFEVWPQSYPFRADYHLSAKELLIKVVDYCRPTDPFKLAIRLLLALQVEISLSDATGEEVKGRNLMTVMSRIAWPLSDFHADEIPCRSEDSKEYRASWLRRVDNPSSLLTTLYLTPQGDHFRPSDEIASMGDASVVIGIRKVKDDRTSDSSHICVGLGFDMASERHTGRVNEAWLDAGTIPDTIEIHEDTGESVTLAKWLQYLPEITVRKAAAEDKGDDGIPVLWWVKAPTMFFWLVCDREKRSRSGSSLKSNVGSDTEDDRASTGDRSLDDGLSTGGLAYEASSDRSGSW